MSYSFNIRAATKADARANVVEEMSKVIASQPVHEADGEAAIAAANSMLGVIRDDEAQEISVTVSGYVTWSDAGINTASVNVNASLVAKAATVEAEAA